PPTGSKVKPAGKAGHSRSRADRSTMPSTSAVRSARARMGSLKGGVSTIVVPNPDSLRHVVHEDLAVADLAGPRRGGQGLEQFIATRIADDDLDFQLGQKIHGVFTPTIDLFVAFLPAMPAHLADGHAIHADARQRFLHFIQLEWLDYGLDFFHIHVSRMYPSSPCMLKSNPATSCDSVTRKPIRASQIFSTINVPTIASTQAMAHPIAWFQIWAGWRSTRPKGPRKPWFTSLVANTPVRSAPRVPPQPCTPKASSESSYPSFCLTLATMK